VRVAFDEQIFAIQEYGGISRLFAELAKQFTGNPAFDVALEPMHAPIINGYVLGHLDLERDLDVWNAESTWKSLGRYFTRMRPKTEVDIIHNTFYLPHGLAGYPGAKRVVTVHDMIPEQMPQTRRRLDFITLKKRYVKSADHVICVSEYTRNDLLRTYGEIKAPISVVYHGVDPVFQPGAERIEGFPERYLVFVGNRGQYKDANVLIEAFAKLNHSDLSVVFVGGGDFSRDEQRKLNDLGIADRVIQRSLPDYLMPAAYGNAVLCVFPSRFEGFGLPALESMACNTATVLANATSLPEVGGDAARYFSPGDAIDLAGVLAELLSDQAQVEALEKAGLQRSREFTWHASAQATADAYRVTLQ
jgi:glycosyltransferase involved in cell wall biosynthesis